MMRISFQSRCSTALHLENYPLSMSFFGCLQQRSHTDAVQPASPRRTQTVFGWTLLLLTSGICGCEAQSTSSSNARPQLPSAQSNASSASESAAQSPISAAAPAEPAGSNSTQVQPAGQSTATPSQPPEAVETAAPAPPLANPTPEQIAKWTQPEFEPLQLLACRDPQDIGLVSQQVQLADGRHFVTAGQKVILWSIADDLPEHQFLELNGDATIKSLVVSPDGQWIAAGDSEGVLRKWSASNFQELTTQKLLDNDLVQIAVSPDSQSIATISFDDQVSVWSTDQLQLKKRFEVKTNGLKRIEFLSNERLVAAGESTTVWNVGTGETELTLSPGRYNYTLGRTPDGERFLFGDNDKLRWWSIREQRPLEEALAGQFASEELLAFAPAGKSLATANGNSVRIWDVASGQLVQVLDTFGWPITGLSWLPESNLLVVTTIQGRVRLWGTATDAERLGLSPLHQPAATSSTAAGTAVPAPATSNQLEQLIDLRTFPKLPNGSVTAGDEFNLLLDVPTTQDEARLFYRYQLRRAGWTESSLDPTTPHLLNFRKDGFMLSVSFYDGADSKTMVNVNFAGNYDLRWLPKFNVAPLDTAVDTVFENENTVMVRFQANLIDIETNVLKQLHAAGWTAFSRLHAASNEEEEVRDLEFVQNGMILHVSIRKFPDTPASFTIQISGTLTNKSIPIPPDSGFVEFDCSTEPMLVATTSMDLTQSRDFYDRELVAQGWLVREFGRVLDDKQNWLTYVRGQRDLTIGLLRLESGKTQVRVGPELEKSSWQLAKPVELSTSETAATGIEAADFPILNDSKSAQRDAIAKSIEFSMETVPLLTVAELYQQQFQTLGWKLDGAGIKADDFVLLQFQLGKAEITLRARITDGKSIVNIQGDGLLWNKPLGGAKRRLSYATWLRTNQHPATLELLEQYKSEMQ